MKKMVRYLFVFLFVSCNQLNHQVISTTSPDNIIMPSATFTFKPNRYNRWKNIRPDSLEECKRLNWINPLDIKNDLNILFEKEKLFTYQTKVNIGESRSFSFHRFGEYDENRGNILFENHPDTQISLVSCSYLPSEGELGGFYIYGIALRARSDGDVLIIHFAFEPSLIPEGDKYSDPYFSETEEIDLSELSEYYSKLLDNSFSRIDMDLLLGIPNEVLESSSNISEYYLLENLFSDKSYKEQKGYSQWNILQRFFISPIFQFTYPVPPEEYREIDIELEQIVNNILQCNLIPIQKIIVR